MSLPDGYLLRNALLDLLFPTHCKACSAQTHLRFLCEECWRESALVDPSYRCRSCFGEVDTPGFCERCLKRKSPFERACLFERTAPIVPLLFQEDAIEAAAGFALYQFLTLGWDLPDVVAPLPPRRHSIASALAELLQVPCRQIFRRRIWPLGSEQWEVKDGEVGEESVVLLLDLGSTPQQLRAASRALASAFPKKGFLLQIRG